MRSFITLESIRTQHMRRFITSTFRKTSVPCARDAVSSELYLVNASNPHRSPIIHATARFIGNTVSAAQQNLTFPSTSRDAAATADNASSRYLPVKGRRRHRMPESQTSPRNVTAYCTAELYVLSRARQAFRDFDFQPDPVRTGLEAQVLHVRMPVVAHPSTSSEEHGDVFVFPSGGVVTWNLPQELADHIVNTILPKAAEQPYDKVEIENFAYIEQDDSKTSKIIGDAICLGTASTTTASVATVRTNEDRKDVTLAQIAYSSALARSTKLAVLEELLSSYFHTTRSIPSTLSAGAALPYTRKFILRKTGELFSIRAQLNLYSELTDSLPDLFWDSPHDLGLEEYYESLGHALDVDVRIRILNQKMDYASEIAAVLRERLSEKHSTGLEWLIIGLISIEVAFGVFHLIKETQEQEELSRVRHLLEKYLQMEITGKTQD